MALEIESENSQEFDHLSNIQLLDELAIRAAMHFGSAPFRKDKKDREESRNEFNKCKNELRRRIIELEKKSNI